MYNQHPLPEDEVEGHTNEATYTLIYHGQRARSSAKKEKKSRSELQAGNGHHHRYCHTLNF